MSYAGNITKRKHKKGYSWELCVELPKDPVTGKRIRKTKTVRGSKKDAERALHEFITELERGIYVEDDKVCISEWIKTWLDVYITPNVSPTTLERYQGMIKRYIDPMIGHTQVQKLTTLAVQAWVNNLKISPATGKEMSAATIKHTYHVLNGAMDKAVLAGIIYRSPCTGIMLPKGQKKPPVIFNEAQIKQLIQAAKGTEMELVIDMELCLGLRRGELLGLRWCDIDWENNQIHIVQNRVVVNSKSLVKEPKTEAGIRIIDAPEMLMKKLRLHRGKCIENRMKMGAGYTVTDYIIVNRDGKPTYPEFLTQSFTKLLEKAELPKCRFHDLRHLCASIMLLQGVNVKVAQERLGHKDIATTMNIYSHVLPSSAKEAAEKIGQLVYAS